MLYSAEKLVPYSSHISPEIIKVKGGTYVMCFRLDGITYLGKEQDEIDNRINQLNGLLTQLRAPLRYNIYLHSHCIRHEYKPELDDNFEPGSFAAQINDEYVSKKIHAGNPVIKTDYFISVLYRPVRKIGSFSLYASTRKQIREFEKKAHEELGKIKSLILDYFADYQIRVLTTFRKENGVLFSQILSFLGLIVNQKAQDVPVMNAQISQYLPTATLSFGNNEVICIDNDGKREYAAILTISEYPNKTHAGILQPFIELPWKMVISQAFMPIDKAEASSWLKRERRRVEGTGDDASDNDIQDLRDALQGVQDDRFVFGDFAWSVMLLADDIDTLRHRISQAIPKLSDCGFTASVNQLAKVHSYFAQLPGNPALHPRAAKLSSTNAVHMMPYNIQNRGKQYGNPWGCAMTMFRTVTDEIFFFNLHDTDKLTNDEDKLVAGNTIICGRTGAGKTVLVSFILAQSQRYHPRPKLIILERDEGSSVFVRAMGGRYSKIRMGEPTGFNPFHLENTKANRTFLYRLIMAILDKDGEKTSAAERKQIEIAIEQTMSGPMELRDIEAFANFLTGGENSVKARLHAWTHGQYAWVFNNPEDNFSLSGHIVGIDYTEFLENDDIRNPILMYLFHRIEQSLDGTPVLIDFDEAWRPFQDPGFVVFIDEEVRTIRKKNGVIIFATQSPSDFFKHVPKSFIEQIATQIYLPNPVAKREDYISNLGLKEEEFQIIKNLRVNSRQFLVKYQAETTLCKLDLHGIPAVDVLSGSEARSRHSLKLMEKYGDNWLEHYYRTVNQVGKNLYEEDEDNDDEDAA